MNNNKYPHKNTKIYLSHQLQPCYDVTVFLQRAVSEKTSIEPPHMCVVILYINHDN